MRIVLIPLFCLIVATPAALRSELARFPDDEDSSKVYSLHEVVVSGTRSAKFPGDIGRSVTLIPNEQINSSIYNNVSELLSQQQGVYIVGTGQNPGMLQSIFMRGAASNQTTILIDEVPITDPSTPTNALDLSELPLLGTDRIELVRGSHSTLYGSSAIGGVVNFFTEKNGQPGFNSSVEMSGGSFGANASTFGENILLNYTSPAGFYLNTGISAANVRGLDATIDTVTNPGAFKNRDRDDNNRRDLLEKIGFKNDHYDLYASYKNTSEESGLDAGAFTDDNSYNLTFRRNLFTYGASDRLSENWTLKFLGGYSDMKRRSIDDSSIVDAVGTYNHTYADDSWKGTMNTNELQANFHSNGIDAVVGGGVSGESMSLQTFYYSGAFGVYESDSNLDTLNIHSSIKNIFFHLEAQGGLLDESLREFSLALGIRANDHSTYGANTTYEVNPSFRTNSRGLIYASFSSGFNAPSLYELYAPDKNYLSGIARGNHQLKPETSDSYEIGLKQSIGSVAFSIDYFHTVISNRIEDVYLWDKNIGIDTLNNDYLRDDFRGDTYLNVGKQTTNGFEITLESKITEQLSLSGNYSLVSGTLDYTTSEINLAQTGGNHVQLYSNGAFVTRNVEVSGLARRPNTANLTVSYRPSEALALKVDARYAGRRNDVFYDSGLGPYGALGTLPIAAYTLVDFSPAYSINDHLRLLGRVENIFNTKYSEISGFTTRGRGVYLSLRYAGQPF